MNSSQMAVGSETRSAEPPSVADGDQVDVTNGERTFDDHMRLFELYSTIQVNIETVYYNRTSLFTLTLGLLLVGYPPLLGTSKTAAAWLAALGTILSLLWLVVEQRNRIFFEGRGAVLVKVETELGRLAASGSRGFVPLWSTVPVWVAANAAWYQRHGAHRAMRTYVPILFCICWLGLLTMSYPWSVWL